MGGTIKGIGVGVKGNVVQVQEDHTVSVDLENCNSLGGSLRGWKRLARERDGVVQFGSPSGVKRSFDECLEGVIDLVPTKRQCVSVKSNETVEADA